MVDELLTALDIGPLRRALNTLDHLPEAFTDGRRQLGRGLLNVNLPVSIHAIRDIDPDP
ncbi:hypothetical protein D3C71_2179190 [compost metagenome]